MAEKELLLHAEQIDKAFGPTHAVDHVSLDFYKGEVHCLIGENGSGKSTLLQLFGGLDQPTAGKVVYQGKALADYSDNQLSVLRRRRFGFVFQSYHLVKELTAKTGGQYLRFAVRDTADNDCLLAALRRELTE